jgi:hypothetical protein
MRNFSDVLRLGVAAALALPVLTAALLGAQAGDPRQGTPTPAADTPQAPIAGVSWRPNADEIALLNRKGELWLCDVRTGAFRRLVEGDVVTGDWSPDGGKIACEALYGPEDAVPRRSRVVEVSLPSLKRRVLCEPGSRPVYSPDGAHVAIIRYVRADGGYRSQVVIAGGQDNPAVVDLPRESIASPAGGVEWSSDGASVALFGEVSGSGEGGLRTVLYVYVLPEARLHTIMLGRDVDALGQTALAVGPGRDRVTYAEWVNPDGWLLRTAHVDGEGAESYALTDTRDVCRFKWGPAFRNLLAIGDHHVTVYSFPVFTGDADGPRRAGSVSVSAREDQVVAAALSETGRLAVADKTGIWVTDEELQGRAYVLRF